MKLGVIQLNSKLDPAENLKIINPLLVKAKKENCFGVFLPEVFYSMSDGISPSPYLIEQDNEHYKAIQNLATSHDLYILSSSAATKHKGKIVNRSYSFSSEGKELSSYDKIHLFACDLSRHESKKVINEANIYHAGSKAVVEDINGWKFGHSICFDIRFPELYRYYRKLGVEIFSAPAAFTVPTGKAHWEILLRSRAIENQAYLFSAAQWGFHNEKIQTYGHSMIIDPWGKILAELPEGEGLITASVDKNVINEIRSRVLMDQRFNL